MYHHYLFPTHVTVHSNLSLVANLFHSSVVLFFFFHFYLSLHPFLSPHSCAGPDLTGPIPPSLPLSRSLSPPGVVPVQPGSLNADPRHRGCIFSLGARQALTHGPSPN